MSSPPPEIFLARHGETAWTISGQHTGLTDLPLTPRGERNARALGEVLKGVNFAHVFTSPLRRARQTCELAGFGRAAILDKDLVEWNYGDYEGKTTTEIHKQRPDWDLFRERAMEIPFFFLTATFSASWGHVGFNSIQPPVGIFC